MNPQSSTDLVLVAFLMANGYNNIRLLPTGELAATGRQMYTCGLFLGLNAIGYRTRFCYDTEQEAAAALLHWSGEGFPPGYWIKQKPEEVIGPGGQEKFRIEASA